MAPDNRAHFTSALLENGILPRAAWPGGPQHGPKQRPPGGTLGPEAAGAHRAPGPRPQTPASAFFFFPKLHSGLENALPSLTVNIHSKLGEKGRKIKALTTWGRAILSTLSKSPSDMEMLPRLPWGPPGSSEDAKEEPGEPRDSVA